ESVPFILRLPVGIICMTPPVLGALNMAPAVTVRSPEEKKLIAAVEVKLEAAATTSGVAPAAAVFNAFKVMLPAVNVPCTVAIEACGGAAMGARRATCRLTGPGVLMNCA